MMEFTKLSKHILCWLSVLMLYTQAAAQQPVRTVTGQVFNEKKEPLPGVSVQLLVPTRSTKTDSEGRFKLVAPTQEGVLVFRFLGYHAKEVAFEENTQSLTVYLDPEAISLNEVEVLNTGYQRLPKERATGSFVQLDNELVNRSVSTDIVSRLEDVTSGLSFDRRMGGTPKLAVRGRSTIFANDEPLIVVDNFPYDGDLDNINPNDVASITVMKDAAAASIWGVRAGNGVIVITTKKGSINQKLAVELNANVTAGGRPDVFANPSFLNSSDFIDVQTYLFSEGFYESWLNDPNRRPISPVVELMSSDMDNPTISQKLNAFRQQDVRKDISKYLYRNLLKQQYAMNFSGGTENTSYFFSTGYDDNMESAVGNTDNRWNANTSLSFKPLKRLSITVNPVYTQSKTANNGFGYNGLRVGSMNLYPYAMLADEAGNFLPIEQDYSNAFKEDMEREGLLDWSYVPVKDLKERNNQTVLQDFRFNTNASYGLMQGLDVQLAYQYELQNADGENLRNADSYFVRNLINRYTEITDNGLIRNIPLGAILDKSVNRLTAHTGRFQINYEKEWQEKHRLVALLGAEVKQLRTVYSSSRVYGYDPEVLTSTPVDYNTNFVLQPEGSSKIPYGNTNRETLNRFRSYFGNLAYSFQEKYQASFSARIDQSNFFGIAANQKSVPLWSIGGAWDVAKEAFYKSAVLPSLKLRATYGFNGNLDKSVTSFVTAYYQTDIYTSAQNAFINNAPNPELRWEKIAVLNLGLDFAFKNDLVSGSIEYYKKSGHDIIGFASLDPTTGVYNNSANNYSYKGNFARTSGKGVDVVLNSINLRSAQVRWTTNLLFSFSADKVTRYDTKSTASNYLAYGSGLTSTSNSISPLEGYPVYSIYAYKWGGLNPQTGDPQGYLDGALTTDYGALISSTTTDDLVYVGRATPAFFGSIRNNISYKNFSLSFNISYKLCYYFRRPGLSYYSLFNYWVGNNEFADRWQNPGDEHITNVPSMPEVGNATQNRDDFYLNSEATVEKGDHVRFKDIRLGYDFRESRIGKLAINNLQLFAYMNNVGILWRKNRYGLDPDYDSAYSFPPLRTISIGFRAKF